MPETTFALLAATSTLLFVLPELLFALDLARSPSRAGTDALLGAQGRVIDPVEGAPSEDVWVEVHGERWRAACEQGELVAGLPVVVLGVQGLTLVVAQRSAAGDEPPTKWELPSNPVRVAGIVVGCLAAITALAAYDSLFPTLVIPLAVGAIWLLLGTLD